MANPTRFGVDQASSIHKRGCAAPGVHGAPLLSETRRLCRKENDAPVVPGDASEPRTILLLSGDDRLRLTLRAFLVHLGFAAISCTDCRRANEIIFSVAGVQLLIIDLSSSPESLLDFAAEFGESIPVVLISGPDLDSEHMKVISARGWKLLRQPFRFPDLLAVIQRACVDAGPRRPDGISRATATTESNSGSSCLQVQRSGVKQDVHDQQRAEGDIRVHE